MPAINAGDDPSMHVMPYVDQVLLHFSANVKAFLWILPGMEKHLKGSMLLAYYLEKQLI